MKMNLYLKLLLGMKMVKKDQKTGLGLMLQTHIGLLGILQHT